LGVASFCLIALFGLVPLGLNTNQNASEQTAAAGVATAISADLHSNPVASGSTSRFGLLIPPAGGGSSVQSLFFTVDGNESATVSTSGTGPSRYRATITLTPVNTTAQNPATSSSNNLTVFPYNKQFNATILITWPALADSNPALPPSNFSGSFQTLTSVNCN
jgi:hypothetical protein